jgi:hypothetical protein
MRPPAGVEELAAVLTDAPADTPWEVFRRCEAADAIGELGSAAAAAIPALARTLRVLVTVDCVLALVACRAACRLGPFLPDRGP